MFSCRISDEVELRPVEATEVGRLPELGIWSEQKFPSESFRLRLMEACEMCSRGESLPCAICVKGQIAGYTILDIHGEMEGHLHYGLAPAQRGKGIVTKCCAAVIDHAFQHLGLRTIKVIVRVSNVKSGRVPERLGFELVGTEWVHDEDENGPLIEVAEYVMSKEAWQSRHRRSV